MLIKAAAYDAPASSVEGDITLKRQFRIREGKMECMLESSLNIHDEILQQELSKASDEKMKNIVATIQRDQNKIIRNLIRLLFRMLTTGITIIRLTGDSSILPVPGQCINWICFILSSQVNLFRKNLKIKKICEFYWIESGSNN